MKKKRKIEEQQKEQVREQLKLESFCHTPINCPNKNKIYEEISDKKLETRFSKIKRKVTVQKSILEAL